MRRSDRAIEIVDRILGDSEHGTWLADKIKADEDVNLTLLEAVCRALAAADRAELSVTDPAKWARRVVEDREKLKQ